MIKTAGHLRGQLFYILWYTDGKNCKKGQRNGSGGQEYYPYTVVTVY